jgi:predicted dehydrogenase
MSRVLGVAVFGPGGIARAHVFAVRRHAEVFADAPAVGRIVAVVGRNAATSQDAAARLGVARGTADWRGVLGDPAVDCVINTGPNDRHAQPSIEALRAGKAVLCEKPLARSGEEARAMVRAAREARGVAMTGFNYRFMPAVLLARRLLREGACGRVFHFRTRYSDDSLLDPHAPFGWRHDRGAAGSGVIGDLAAHAIDLGHFLVGPVTAVTAAVRTFTPARPSGEAARPVTVEDAVVATLEFDGGAVGTLEASGMCPGRKNHLWFEVSGERGTLVFDLERLNELRVYHGDGPARGLADVLVTERDHPFGGRWWPPGHVLGWEHSFVHQFEEFVRRIEGAGGERVGATFEDGRSAALVCDALLRAAETGRRVSVEHSSEEPPEGPAPG